MQRSKVPCGLNAVVQYTNYLNVRTDLLVEDDVRAALVSMQSCSQLFGATFQSRIVFESIETGAEFIAIAPRLFIPAALDGLSGDRFQIHRSAA